MNRTMALSVVCAAMAALSPAAQAQAPQPGQMTFFVTSVGSGRGGDLGGLAGADAHCQALALATGVGPRNWRAYLSTSATGSTPAVNARDRIGRGPWQNTQGVVIARSVEDLHSDSNNLTKQTALNERGAVVNGGGDTPNTHDMLTGSQADGTAFSGSEDRTCRNWTYGGADGSAMLGHHDRRGLQDDAPSRSWNTSHPSRGCTVEGLRSTGGGGLFYCFAVD
ncbi:hypothetical protein AAFN86_09245 [Roseomonas sp. CAU 1739]|uniref:hypothetical protein n=1 Tax=Roseomonas sp. CAU 1739 TaxID=3140364 RepID=UPI00325B13A3